MAKRIRDTARTRRAGRGGVPNPRTHGTRETGTAIRLNRYLAEAGIASRRKADELIAAGSVKVNGKKVIALGSKVNPGIDTVSVRGRIVRMEPKLVYILLNKPKDCITTTRDEKGRHTVLELVPAVPHLFPVGRLDRNTTGALLLTNDGDLGHRLMHPRFGVLKTYGVQITTGFKKSDLAQLTGGMEIDATVHTAPCEAVITDPPRNTHVLVRLHEGKYRQIRRMFERLGYGISKLDRVDYAGLTTDGLRRGEWRYLSEKEVRRLRALTDRQ